MGEEDKRVESMIASLEENRLIAEAERQSAERLRREAEEMRQTLEAQQAKFDEQRDKLLEKAERDAREAVAKARREADEVIADLRRMAQEEAGGVKDHRLVEAKRRLDQAAPELREKQVRAAKKRPERIEAGDEVRVVTLGQKGHVVEIVSATEATVQLGIMKMKVAVVESREDRQCGSEKASSSSGYNRQNEHGMITSEWNWICAV